MKYIRIGRKMMEMIRLIKKWWLVRNLYKLCSNRAALGTTEDVLEHRMMFREKAFVELMAKKSLSRFSWILWWRKTTTVKRLNKKIYEYNSIITSLKLGTPGYVVMDPTDNNFIFTTHSADDFMGFFPLLQKLLSDFYYVWIVLIIPLLIGAYGSPYIKALIRKVF